MPRYFLEVAYEGTNYSGFQVQQNANSIQAEIEKALSILWKEEITLTGSSRTDAGVHALQNFFHFDTAFPLQISRDQRKDETAYKLNAILPPDIVVKAIYTVEPGSNCRFDALSREYKYFIYRCKDPFLRDRAFYFPYTVDRDLMDEAASIIMTCEDFTSFSKRKTQAKTFICQIQESSWRIEGDCLVYSVKADRFLRGMVRALVATMLKVGRKKISLAEFKGIIEARDCTKASFAVPAHGLFLMHVEYPGGYLRKS